MTDPRAPVFAAVRAEMPNVWNDAGNVLAMDNLLDALGFPRETTRAVSKAGIDLIKQFEGCKLTAYPDPGTGGDPWTIGWGATGPDIRRGLTWTQEQADARLEADVQRFARGVAEVVPQATQSQFDALVSFAYNVGLANLRSSTLLRKHNAGDFAGAAAEFARWNRAAGKVLPGLTRRREAEAALYGASS